MLKIIEENNSLKIFINNTLVFDHSYQKPAVFLGRGNETINMKKGNFEICDSLEEKIALRSYEILYSNQIRFYSNDYISMKIKIDTEKDFFYFKFEKNDHNRFWIRFYGEEEEGIFGLGEQYSELNLKGKKVPLWVSEQGVGRNKKELLTFFADKIDNAGGDWYTTYYPQPTYVSSRKYSCIVEGSSYMEFDFSKKDNEIFSFEIPDKIIFCTGKTLKTVLKNQSALLGNQPALPEWTGKGITLGLQGGTEVVLPKLIAAQNKGLKVNAIWIQDWSGKNITDFGKQVFWNWRYSEEMYPDLPQTIREVKNEGIRVMGYINPFLIPEGDVYKEGAEKGYFVKNTNGEIYHVIVTTFPAAIVDLTNKKAYDWYKNIIKENLIRIGFSGWMADYGEYLPADAVLHSGISAKKYHNIYPVDWTKLNREAIEEEGKLGDIMFFTRAGYLGTTKYSTMVWNGDQMVDWSLDDGLASVIPASISLGYRGFNLCHSDIGGFTTIDKPFGNYVRSKELFMRWSEMAAFSSYMRTHEGNIPEINWQFDSDSETIEHLSKFVNVFVALQPYIKDTTKKSQKKGLPIIRHTFLNNENELKFMNDKYQYMLGEDILVCPVIKEGSEKIKVNFPVGKWINFWNGKEYEGGIYEVAAPIGNPAVFYKYNSKWEKLFKSIKENI